MTGNAQQPQAVHNNTPQGTGSKPLRFLANLVSYVFHPVFMPFIMTVTLYKLSPTSFAGITFREFSLTLISIFVSSILIPLVAILLMKKLGLLKDIFMRDAKDRIIPLIIMMTMYFWVYLVFKNTGVPLLLRTFFLGNFLGVTLLFMVTIFYKASMHTAAAGGVLGLIIVLMMISPINMAVPLFAAIFFAGMIGTARLLLGAHHQSEIWLGYVLGIVAQVGAYWYLT